MFMQPQIVHDRWATIETKSETHVVEADSMIDVLRELDVEDIVEIHLEDGWGARFSAPGYLDCTGWGVYESEASAAEALLEEMDCDCEACEECEAISELSEMARPGLASTDEPR